jgi:hypothetical protein
MTITRRRPAIAHAPRPWLSRLKGECAYPAEGEGVATQSCCNPCGQALYCFRHARIMRGPACSAADDYEREIMRFLEPRR